MKLRKHTLFLTQVGLIGGAYATLALAIAPLSFGPVQCRLAEALTVLAAYSPTALPGLTVGCLVANLLGLAFGASAVGVADLLLGPLATLLAALLSYATRHIRVGDLPVLSTLPPVFINALVIGTELALAAPVFSPAVWLTHAGVVAAGQLLACVGGGLAVAKALQSTGMDKRLLGNRHID